MHNNLNIFRIPNDKYLSNQINQLDRNQISQHILKHTLPCPLTCYNSRAFQEKAAPLHPIKTGASEPREKPNQLHVGHATAVSNSRDTAEGGQAATAVGALLRHPAARLPRPAPLPRTAVATVAPGGSFVHRSRAPRSSAAPRRSLKCCAWSSFELLPPFAPQSHLSKLCSIKFCFIRLRVLIANLYQD
jgi:hypothetical protein